MSKKQIDKLTPAQEAKIPEYLERYREIGLSTRPTDRAKAEKAILANHAYQKLPVPEIIWAEDPFEGAKLAAQHAKGDTDVTVKEIQDQATKASYGSLNAHWVVFYSFIARELEVTRDELIDIVDDMIAELGVYWVFKDLVIATPKPIAIHMKDKKLHNPDGLAIKYATGRGVYAVNGRRLNSLMEVALAATYGNEKNED